MPDDVAALEALPGIGTYTARAVACFGYGQPQPVVDTNVRRVVARLVHGRAEAGNARAADLADIAALTPADPARAARFSVAAMELGALVCVAGTPRCGACPVRDRCAWRLAGSPPHDGPPRRVQKFAGTDRQVRGRLLDVLRAAHDPVPAAALDAAWDDAVQRDRCLDSLLADGLVEQTDDGRFRLPQQVTDRRTGAADGARRLRERARGRRGGGSMHPRRVITRRPRRRRGLRSRKVMSQPAKATTSSDDHQRSPQPGGPPSCQTSDRAEHRRRRSAAPP